MIMKRLKNKRVHGMDWILDANSLKIASPLIEDSFIHLTNLSIRTGSFATSFATSACLPFSWSNRRFTRPGPSHLSEASAQMSRQ